MTVHVDKTRHCYSPTRHDCQLIRAGTARACVSRHAGQVGQLGTQEDSRYTRWERVAQRGLEKCCFFLQRDSHSAGCTRQTPPNRVSADSPSRILPGDVLVSLRFPPPEEVTTLRVAERKFSDLFSEVFFRADKKIKRGRDHSLARGNTIKH